MENINLNLYKTFYVVATSKTFNDAANKLFVSQPAVSKQIKNLETILDVKLFYRLNKGIELTKEGKILFDQIEKMFFCIDTSYKNILLAKNLMAGELVIGCPSHITSFYLMNFIKLFRKEHPEIEIRIDSSSTNSLIDSLEHHKVDFIIDSLPIESNCKNLLFKPIKALGTTFIASKEYDNKITNILDLNGKCFILPPERSPIRKNLESELKKHKVKIDAGLMVDTTDLIISSVKNNLGIGYVIKDAVKQEIDDGNIIELDVDIKLPHVELCLVYLDNYLSYPAKVFLEEYIKLI